MIGTISLVAFAIFLAAVVVLLAIATRAATRRPTLNELHPENASRYVVPASGAFIVAFIAALVGVIAGLWWILEQLLT